MRVVVIDAPEGIEVTWYTDESEEILYVAMPPSLDEVTRQRYIAQAKAEKGVTDERRGRRILPLLPFAGRHAAGHSKTAAAVIAGTTVVAAGVAAAVIVPAALNRSHQQGSHRPSAAAPPHGTPPSPSQPPSATPSDPPGQSPTQPPANQPGDQLIPQHSIQSALGPTSVRSLRGDVKSLPPRLPLPPKPSLPSVRPPAQQRDRAPIKVALPGARVHVAVRPELSLDVRLGLLQPRPVRQP